MEICKHFCCSSSPLVLLETHCSIIRQNRNMLQYQNTNSVVMNKSELPNYRRMQTLLRRIPAATAISNQHIHLDAAGSILANHGGEFIYSSHDLSSNPGITFTYIPESRTSHLEHQKDKCTYPHGQFERCDLTSHCPIMLHL